MKRFEKLSDLTPCMNPACRGPLTRGFVVLHMSQGLINAGPANEVLGLSQYFARSQQPTPASLALAEHFTPRADGAVLVFGDKDPSLYSTVVVCQDCWLMADLNLALLWDLARRRPDEEEARS